MQELRELLAEKEKQLSDILLQENMAEEKVKPGRLRISNVDGNPVYYYCETDPATKQKREQYIRKNDLGIAHEIAQQEYVKKVRRAAGQQLTWIRKLLKSYDNNQLEMIYKQLHPARRALIQPVVPDWDEFLSEWDAKNQNAGGLQDGFLTERGDFVRSKSEKIIADKYLKLGIPYQYEKPLTLLDGGRPVTLHPDFTLLKRGDCREYYHEHFGMMDNPGYCENAIQKILLYRENGIFEGERLLLTFETKEHPLNMHAFEHLIKHHLIRGEE